MTSNPAIFEKAITGTTCTTIFCCRGSEKLDANGIFEKIAIRDVQDVRHIQAGVCGNEMPRRLRQPGGLTVLASIPKRRSG